MMLLPPIPTVADRPEILQLPKGRAALGRKTANPLEAYFRAIDETPLLTANQEKELAYRVQDGDPEARDRMVRANLRLVVKIARSFGGRGLDLPDLIEEGNLGLLRAVDGFDPSMNTRFSTYASYWIKQAIRRALIYTAKTIRIPAHMMDLISKWRWATNRLQDQLNRPPTLEEVAKSINMPLKKLGALKKAIRAYNTWVQTDQPDRDWSIDEYLPDERAQTADEVMAEDEDRHLALSLLETLDAREATVLRMRFGLGGQEASTLDEIGHSLGLTRERVRQLQAQALRKLNERLQREGGSRSGLCQAVSV